MTLKDYNTPGYLLEVATGYALGDGHIDEGGILTVDQGEQQADFAYSLYDIFSPFLKDPLKGPKVVNRRHRVTGKVTRSVRFFTQSVFKSLRKKLYVLNPATNRYEKHLPPKEDLKQMLTPTAFAVWFCCDGTKTLCKKVGAQL